MSDPVQAGPEVSDRSDTLRMRLIVAAILVAAVLAFVLGLVVMKGCSPAPVIVPEPGIDAGPGEEAIAVALDAALQAEEEEIRALEAAHRDELDRFDEHQREEYERVRTGGRVEVARWLSTFNRGLKDGGT